eukprot:3121575-Amphidinium_carterae.1
MSGTIHRAGKVFCELVTISKGWLMQIEHENLTEDGHAIEFIGAMERWDRFVCSELLDAPGHFCDWLSGMTRWQKLYKLDERPGRISLSVRCCTHGQSMRFDAPFSICLDPDSNDRLGGCKGPSENVDNVWQQGFAFAGFSSE